MSKKKRTITKTRSLPAGTLSIQRNWILAFILGVTFLTFANTLGNDFAYDDQTFILQNQIVQSSSLREAVSKIPVVLTKELWFYRVMQDKDPNKETGPTTPYYRPTFSIFHMICWQLFQDKPGGWHLMNILVHLLAVYFVFLILERLTKDLKVSAIACLLFAIHPLRVESVAWICGISDPFLAIFLLPSFYLYMRYRDEDKPKLLAWSLVLFLFAAFTKEPAGALPIFIAAYEVFVINQSDALLPRIKSAVKYSAYFLVASGLYFGARYYALGFALNNGNFKSYPFWQILLTIPLVIWKYIALLIWPVDLSLFHATYMIKSPLGLDFILPIVGLIALVLGLWRLRGSIVARFAILWFTINLLPVLNLSAFGEDFLVQERYVYIPSIGFSLLVAMALTTIPVEQWLPLGRRRVAQTAIVGLLVLLLAGKSVAQNTVWKDDIRRWSYGAEAADEQAMSHYILGHKLVNLGQLQRAAEQFDAFLKLSPNNLIVISNLAATHLTMYQDEASVNPGGADRAHLDRALQLCESGLAINSNFEPIWDTLGTVHTFETGLKNYDRAIACFQHGLSLNPANAMINYHLGGTFAKKGDLDNGIRYLQIAIQLDPNIVDAHKFLGYAYRAKGQLKEAIDELGIYLKLQPKAPDVSRVARDLKDFQMQLQAVSAQS